MREGFKSISYSVSFVFEQKLSCFLDFSAQARSSLFMANCNLSSSSCFFLVDFGFSLIFGFFIVFRFVPSALVLLSVWLEFTFLCTLYLAKFRKFRKFEETMPLSDSEAATMYKLKGPSSNMQTGFQ